MWQSTIVKPITGSNITVLTDGDNVYSFEYDHFYANDVAWCYTDDLINSMPEHLRPTHASPPPMKPFMMLFIMMTVLTLIALSFIGYRVF